jgi:hypothetical protein
MDNGRHADLLPVYKSSNRPDVLEFESGELETGLPYRFSVQAININGLSNPSDIVTIYACAAPRDFKTPSYLASDGAA